MREAREEEVLQHATYKEEWVAIRKENWTALIDLNETPLGLASQLDLAACVQLAGTQPVSFRLLSLQLPRMATQETNDHTPPRVGRHPYCYRYTAVGLLISCCWRRSSSRARCNTVTPARRVRT